MNSHLRHARKVRARTIAICVALVFCISLISAFLPEVVSAGWHLLHGSSVKFLAWDVPVPRGWREFKGNNSIIIQKMGRWNDPPSDAIVTTVDFGAIGHEQWKNARVDTELKSGHSLLSEVEAPLDGEMGFCFTFGVNEHPDLRWIYCDFPIHRLSIGYIGTEEHSHILNLIIPKIRASK